MGDPEHIDDLLRDWPYDPSSLCVRIVSGSDGRDVLQLRLDMGILQLEIEGRPDGVRPHGYETYLDYLLQQTVHSASHFVMDEEQCAEVDREFVQYYHRRICWLRLQNYQRAVQDADHTLALMTFCKQHSPDEPWMLSHEQYRPFVMFHRTQASALVKLENEGPEAAVQEVNHGLEQLRAIFSEHGVEEQFEGDELVARLRDFRETLRRQHHVGRTLQEQLADAVAAEQYELAAKIRDELARRRS